MTLTLRWRFPARAIATRWRGLDDETRSLAAANAATPLAALIGPPGLEGPPGADGAGLTTYLHDQPAAASTWTVNHNLGRRPASVSVRSPGGMEVTAGVLHVSDNQLQISFAAPASGSALVQ